MRMPFEDQVAPDLIRNDNTVVFPVDFHRLFNLFPLPDPAGGVVGGAENSKMDMVFLQLPVHILIIHPPDALLILVKLAVDDTPPRIVYGAGEADVGGGMEEDCLAGGR